MDINSLLSPSESPAPRSPSAGSPAKQYASFPAPTSAPGSQSSPRRLHDSPTTSQRASIPSPPSSDFPTRPHRQSSTSGMDTLADLAAMQHHQHTARANAGGLRSNESYEAQLFSANIRPSLQAIARTHSGSRSSLDIRMADVPAQTPPMRVFTAPSLNNEQRQRVAQLVTNLSENAHAYDSHVELIRLLYHGLVAHVYPNSPSVQENDAFGYELLGELRQALEAMATRFSLGETLWEIQLRTLLLTATSSEDCVGLMEAFEKSVAECPASPQLWAMYGEWYLSLHATVGQRSEHLARLSKSSDMPLKLSEEDKLVLGEVFTSDQMTEIWKRGAEDTKYRIDTSSLVWDKWLDLQLLGLEQSATKESILSMRTLLLDRLSTPHRTWDDTFQKFSTFVSSYDSANYEETMVAVSSECQTAKNAMGAREIFETSLEQAMEAGDREAELATFTEYTEWELARNRKKGLFSFDLTNALFQRLVLRFPSDVNGWEDYLTFLADEAHPRTRSVSQLAVLNRACNHCPWSGVLWAQYIQAAELENLDFADIGQIKHKATSTGLLDLGSMEEVLKIHMAWCGFLRRQAFRRESTDEELDVAEVGIRSAIEDTETLGKDKYGADYQGDPQYRLERIYVKFLVQARNYGAARDTWKKLIPRHGDSYEFWIRYYSWEMLLWATMMNAEATSAARQTPKEATAVLRRAIQRQNLDWPEKVIETYLSHCEDHENVDELQTAILQCRKAAKLVNKRREREARHATELAQAQAPPLIDDDPTSSKRKRDEEVQGSSKKAKASAQPVAPAERAPSPAADPKPQVKRDRENATVVVRNLPVEASEKHIRHFFHDCGTINSMQLMPKDSTLTVVIEFETKDDALTAQTKDRKSYESNIISVSIGSGTTLYVTNFPPTADEAWIRNVFTKFGDIASIRFPSLKYATHRRFCYVQFATPAAAQSATSLDGENIEGLPLLAKLSDPSHKQARSGAIADGREVYVANLDWGATEDDVRDLFAQHGVVERVRLPRKVDGKSKGMAFVVFSTKEEAESSLSLNAKPLKSRPLSVEIATANPSKRQTTLRAGSPGSSAVTADPETIAARTLSLLNIPDTVSAARVQTLAERHGNIVKVVLRPEKGGALVEYASVKEAGAAALGLEGTEVDGMTMRVGEAADLRDGKAGEPKRGVDSKGHTKNDLPPKGEKSFPKNELSMGAGKSFQPVPVRRPGLGSASRGTGRRGGLGIKARNEGRNETNGDGDGDGEEKAEKSNADFRAMVARGKNAKSG